MTSKRLSQPHPIVQAIILADEVYTDSDTGKKIIAGTFNGLWGHDFPTEFDRTTKVYLSLTNCRGDMLLQMRYIDLSDDEVLMESPEVNLECDDPLAITEVVMEVPPFPMPHVGHYEFEVRCNGERLGGIRINVNELEEDGDEFGTGFGSKFDEGYEEEDYGFRFDDEDEEEDEEDGEYPFR